MTRAPWSEEEAQFLEQLAGEVPWPEAMRRFRKRGRQMGWPERSDKALTLKAAKLVGRLRSTAGRETTTYGAMA